MRKQWLVAAIVLLGVALVGVWFVRGPDAGAVDLVEQFPEAEKRTNFESIAVAFDVLDVTLGGDTRLSIFAHPTSRIIWRIRIPERAELKTALGVREQAWTVLGDGVMFRIGISDGKIYDQRVMMTLDPYHRPEDRRWVDVAVDLANWAGEDVEVIFNTEPGPNGNAASDFAVWGRPRIEVRGP